MNLSIVYTPISCKLLLELFNIVRVLSEYMHNENIAEVIQYMVEKYKKYFSTIPSLLLWIIIFNYNVNIFQYRLLVS